MAKIRVAGFGVSLDGYGAGPKQSLNGPLGEMGEELQRWMVPTRTFQRILGKNEGSTGIDDDIASKGFEDVGAWIIGRNMFGPIRGDWGDQSWKGWWGEDPPFHVPVFVLTHHPRGEIAMQGGTTFHFVTDGIESALEQACVAAAGKDVRIGGGVATIRQYLKARLVDELCLASVPVLLGRGESLFHGLDLRRLGYRFSERIVSEAATHILIERDAKADRP